jgi:hypothetical protein
MEIKIGTLISFCGSLAVIIGVTHSATGIEWVRVHWSSEGSTTWEEWECNKHHFEVIG